MGISCYSLKSTRQNSFRCDAACDAYLGADQRADLRTDFWVDRRFRSWLTKSDYFSGDHKLEWNRFWKKTIPGLIVGLISGLSGEVSGRLIVGLIVGLSVGVIFGLFGRLVTGLVGGFTDRVKVDKASPNQGIKLSLRNSLAAVLVSWLTVGIFGLLLRVAVGLNSTMNYGIGDLLIFELIFGLIVALNFGLIVGLNRGGSAVIKHLCVTSHSLAERRYATRFCPVPRPLRQADFPEESGRWLHLHPPDAPSNISPIFTLSILL